MGIKWKGGERDSKMKKISKRKREGREYRKLIDNFHTCLHICRGDIHKYFA